MTTYILRPENARPRMAAAWRKACSYLELGQSVRLEMSECKSKRSLEQNSRLWALLHDVSRQVKWPVDGRETYLSPEDWKDIFTASLRKGQRVSPGIDGGFVMLGARTSRMTVGEMVDLQTLIEAFGAHNGVAFGDMEKVA